MTKIEFVKKCAEEAELSQKKIKEVLASIGDNIVGCMKDEDGVTPFPGMKFSAVYKEARTGRNPSTGETISIPAKYHAKAKFGVAVKNALNA